jgi:hypothetical protein
MRLICDAGLAVASRAALSFDVRYLIWEFSLSVSGGIGSS